MAEVEVTVETPTQSEPQSNETSTQNSDALVQVAEQVGEAKATTEQHEKTISELEADLEVTKARLTNCETMMSDHASRTNQLLEALTIVESENAGGQEVQEIEVTETNQAENKESSQTSEETKTPKVERHWAIKALLGP